MSRVWVAPAFALMVVCSWSLAGCETTPPSELDAGTEARPDVVSGSCSTDLDCTDRLFCNGPERCAPTDELADSRGCVAGESPCAATEECDELAGRCRPICDVEPDADGDGHITDRCGGDDCDDTDANRYPGNAEVCDAAHDEDCNPDTLGFVDADGDGAGSAACCNGINCGPDCDDANAGIGPGEVDGPPLTCDGLDNDCDGTADVGCPCIESDVRACGSPPQLMRVGLCLPGSQLCIGGAWTEMCVGGVAPTEEICDGLDNDCDGSVDEGALRRYYRDEDGDGYGVPSETIEACSAPDGYARNPDDCDDARAGVSPESVEVCNGRDDDCDTRTDEGATRTFYRDADGDGFGVATSSMMACIAPAGYTDRIGDCNDMRASVNPAALEICDGIDNDCDMSTDVGCACTDGATRPCGASSTGACRMGVQRCIGGAWAECVGAITPTAETCNALDDDCDTRTDEGTLRAYYRDADGDGFGVASMVMMTCAQPGGYSPLSTDCNDTNAAISPAAPELCDGVDNNCVAGVDEGCLCTDGTTQMCGTPAPGGGILTTGECAAGNQLCLGGRFGSCIGTVGPAAETCNTRDDDCDGRTDEGLTRTCYFDGDRDGAGAGPTLTVCTAAGGGCPVGYATTGSDCNDMTATIRPGAPELCNGIDDNCDMMADETFACVQNSITYCETGCMTSGQRSCTASCTWREPVCSAPAESCNYCDDNGNGTFYDERALAIATARLSAPSCAADGLLYGTATCETYNTGSPISVVHRVARLTDHSAAGAGAFWFRNPVRVGYGTTVFDVQVIATDTTSTTPLYGWALVVARDAPGATLGASTTTLGVPTTRRGMSVEWQFFGATTSDPADRISVRRLIGIGGGSLLTSRGATYSTLDNSLGTVVRTQTLRVEYTPEDSLAGVSERLVVSIMNSSTFEYEVLIDSDAGLGGFAPAMGFVPGTDLYVGVTATSPASGARIEAELAAGVLSSIRPTTHVTAQQSCAP